MPSDFYANAHAQFLADRLDEQEDRVSAQTYCASPDAPVEFLLADIAAKRRILELHGNAFQTMRETAEDYGPSDPAFLAPYNTWLSYQEVVGELCDIWEDHPNHPGEAL